MLGILGGGLTTGDGQASTNLQFIHTLLPIKFANSRQIVFLGLCSSRKFQEVVDGLSIQTYYDKSSYLIPQFQIYNIIVTYKYQSFAQQFDQQDQDICQSQEKYEKYQHQFCNQLAVCYHSQQLIAHTQLVLELSCILVDLFQFPVLGIQFSVCVCYYTQSFLRFFIQCNRSLSMIACSFELVKLYWVKRSFFHQICLLIINYFLLQFPISFSHFLQILQVFFYLIFQIEFVIVFIAHVTFQSLIHLIERNIEIFKLYGEIIYFILVELGTRSRVLVDAEFLPQCINILLELVLLLCLKVHMSYYKLSDFIQFNIINFDQFFHKTVTSLFRWSCQKYFMKGLSKIRAINIYPIICKRWEKKQVQDHFQCIDYNLIIKVQKITEMKNKENSRIQKDKSAIFLSHKPKPRQRYPLKDLDKDNNSIQVSPSKRWMNKPILNSQNDMNLDGSQISMSLKQKFRCMHITSVHQLIASARQKKSEIEDLLRKEENKAQFEELEEGQVSASLRKLKRVVRLMQIVCKIILGKNQQNSYIDIGSYQSISLKQMHNQSMENYEHELKMKNSEIQRLKKLVEILSVPSKEKDFSLQIQNETFIVRNSFSSEEPIKNTTDSFVQTEDFQLPSQIETNTKEILERINTIRSSAFSICHQYSIWNILDACMPDELELSIEEEIKQLPKITIKSAVSVQNHEPEDQQRNVPARPISQSVISQENPIAISKRAVEQSTIIELDIFSNIQVMQKSRAFGVCQHPSIHIQSKCNFLKRYKSIVKIALNSLNLCNNIFLKLKQTPQINNLCDEIEEISKYFNKQYHNYVGKYNDEFCKEVKTKMEQVYENIHNIYKSTIINHDLLSNLI